MNQQSKRTNHTKRSTGTAELSWTVLTLTDQLGFNYVELYNSKAQLLSELTTGSAYKNRESKHVTVTAMLEFSALAGAKAALLWLSDKAILNNATLRQEYGMEWRRWSSVDL